MTKPHPPWSHPSINGPGPPSSPAIAGSLEKATSATTTVLQPSQSASPIPARGTTEARSPVDIFDEPATHAPLPSRTPRPHQPIYLVPATNWLTSAVPVSTTEQTTHSPAVKLKIVAKHSKTGAGTSRQLPKVSLAQPSSALLTGAAATSTPLPTCQERSGSASSSSTNTLPADANNLATTIPEPVTRARTRMSHAKTPSSSPTLPPK